MRSDEGVTAAVLWGRGGGGSWACGGVVVLGARGDSGGFWVRGVVGVVEGQDCGRRRCAPSVEAWAGYGVT